MDEASKVGLARRFKVWFAWQDEAHGQWLQRMAARGLHLRTLNWLGIHTFERGAPGEVAYRWDVGADLGDLAYQQLLEDAGWEYVTVSGGQLCWRKPLRPGQTVEILTDTEDKVRRYRRMMVPHAALALFCLVFFKRNWANVTGDSLFFAALSGVSLAILAINLYSLAGLARRISVLRRSL